MRRNRLGYVNLSALIDEEQTMITPHMTASDRRRTEQPRTEPGEVHCPPMMHQNSGSHGYEMYPQQFVRLVGCHDASVEPLRKREDDKLH
jgi:hypothetical protein